MTESLIPEIDKISDSDRHAKAIDLIVTQLLEHPHCPPDEQSGAVENLLIACGQYGVIPSQLERLIIEQIAARERHFLGVLKFSCFGYRSLQHADALRKRIADLVIKYATRADSVIEMILFGFKLKPRSALLHDLVEGALRKFGAKPILDYVLARTEEAREMPFPITEEFMCLTRLCHDLGFSEFSTLLAEFEKMAEDDSQT
jgi:hypothetical protein